MNVDEAIPRLHRARKIGVHGHVEKGSPVKTYIAAQNERHPRLRALLFCNATRVR
jgi:hypothetical protein